MLMFTTFTQSAIMKTTNAIGIEDYGKTKKDIK